MKMYDLFNKIENKLLVPIIISSFLLSFSEIFNLVISNTDFLYKDNLSTLQNGLKYIIPYVICFFITSSSVKGEREFKGFWAIMCLTISLLIARDISLSLLTVLSFIIAVVVISCFNNIDRALAIILSVLASLIFGLLLSYVNEYFISVQMNVAELVGNNLVTRLALFSPINIINQLFNNSFFEELFFHKSYGGAFFINDELITGVKDLYSNEYKGDYISVFLSGKVFEYFIAAGISYFLSSELKEAQRLTLIFSVISFVISGNPFLFLLFIFIQTPFLFISFSLLTTIGFIVSYLLKLNIGYALGGSFIELIINIDKPVYVLACGIVFIAASFFVSKLVFERYGISNNMNVYIPSKLNTLVRALGGINNIIRFKDDKIEVRNPKLVDTLSYDFQIEENLVFLSTEEHLELKEYL